MVWHLWCERNSRIFIGIELPVRVRVTLITQDCKHLILNTLDSKKINRELGRILLGFGINSNSGSEFHPP